MSLTVVCLGATPQQEISNNPIKKPKNKATPILYSVEAVVNTPRWNMRQTKQSEDSPFISEDKVGHQSSEVNISDLLLELCYSLINEFGNVFGYEASMES